MITHMFKCFFLAMFNNRVRLLEMSSPSNWTVRMLAISFLWCMVFMNYRSSSCTHAILLRES